MKINKLYISAGIAIFIAGTYLVNLASAAQVPNLMLSTPNPGSDSVTVTVYGADPNLSVMLYHPSASSYVSTNLGTTNQTGYFMTNVSSITSGIAPNAPAYVMVGGQQSQIKNWPNYTSNGGLPLSQTSVSVTAGQSTTVSASVSAALNISNNSNSTVATAYINGNQINITGLTQGTSNITVCANGVGCSTVNVTVQSGAISTPSSVTLSQNNPTINIGQSQTITITGSGNYYVSSNSAPGVVSYSLTGSTLTLNALSSGTGNLGVCATNNNTTSCSSLTVTVIGTNNTNNTTNNQSVTFSPSNVNLTVGQRQSVAIYGSGNYYVTSNSSQNSVTANISGTNVDLVGVAFGGANIQICQISGGCGNLYAYVAPTNTIVSPTDVQASGVPSLSSISVSSNGINGFSGAGSLLTFVFSTNQQINSPAVTVGGSSVSVIGGGNGPYTASYVVKGTESQPMSFEVKFTNLAGTGGQAYISLGASAGGNPISSDTNTSGSNTTHGGTTNIFVSPLSNGSTGAEVTALQTRLTTLGFYSGPITGKFATLTQAAVRRYQASHGLSQVGVVGPATRALLNQGK